MSARTSRLLWIDCTAGLIAGCILLSLSDWLSTLYALPVELLRFNGWVNLAYGTYSLNLALRRPPRPMALITLLAAANGGWAVVCLVLLLRYRSQYTILGFGQLFAELVFVGGLASVEWKARQRLALGT